MIKLMMSILRLLVELIIFFLSHVVPKNSNKWIFSAWGGEAYLDNPRSIFEQMQKDGVCEEICWLTKSKSLNSDLRRQGLRSAYAYSLWGIYWQLTAGKAIYSHQVNAEFVACLLSEHVKRIQTWHGLPIKKINADSLKTKREHLHVKLKKYIFRHLHEKCDLVLACSEVDRSIFAGAFSTSIERVKITGYPRNDQLLNSRDRARGGCRIIYMPTFRGAPKSESKLLDLLVRSLKEIDCFLDTLDVELTVKLHPVQKISREHEAVIKRSKRIRILSSLNPIYEELSSYAILITDFSGVYFDYLLLDRPIVMAPLEMERYLNEDRSIYYKYEDLCIMRPCNTWSDILEQIEGVLVNKEYNYRRHSELKKKYHLFCDNNSSRRAYQAIKDL